jgi:uncharacterized protein with ParB-like and HNH nuclease domain
VDKTYLISRRNEILRTFGGESIYKNELFLIDELLDEIELKDYWDAITLVYYDPVSDQLETRLVFDSIGYNEIGHIRLGVLKND